jgi:hypothetical protein
MATSAAIAVAVGVIAGPAFAKAPSIAINAPQSVPAGSTYTIKVSGYFNCTKKNITHRGACANIADIKRYQGSLTCTGKIFEHGTVVADGGADKKLRAKTLTRPARFSATENVKAPDTAGTYTLCGFLIGFPADGVSKHVATAHFSANGSATYTLTVSIAGSGAGQVTGGSDAESGTGNGIYCDPFQGYTMCSDRYAAGTTVNLKATSLGGDWAGWSGACSGTNSECQVTMDSDKTVMATFNGG